MSKSQESSVKEAANSLGGLAAFFCAFAGYDQGGWPGALIAAALAFGGVHLMFAAISLAFRLAIGAVILLVILAALGNRAQWLAGLFQ